MDFLRWQNQKVRQSNEISYEIHIKWRGRPRNITEESVTNELEMDSFLLNFVRGYQHFGGIYLLYIPEDGGDLLLRIFGKHL
jgi:hypothetical protein